MRSWQGRRRLSAHALDSGGARSGVDERDAGADVRVAIVYLAEAAAAPGEVHLGDEHPVVVRRDGHHLREVPGGARSLHQSREVDCRARNRRAPAPILRAVEQIGLIAVQFIDPPVAVAERAARGWIFAGVNRIDQPIAVRWRGPERETRRPEVCAMARLPNGIRAGRRWLTAGGSCTAACASKPEPPGCA